MTTAAGGILTRTASGWKASTWRPGKAHTENGEKLFLVIQIDDRERTVWLHHRVLENVIRRANQDKPIEPGERIIIERLGERESASERRYIDYRVIFLDWPKATLSDLLGASSQSEPEGFESEPEGQPDEEAERDDIPF